MKRSYYYLAFVCLFFSSCAGTCNRTSRDGGFWGTYPGDWVVVKYCGYQICDVWKLEDVYVQSESDSDGWLFVDKDGNAIHVGGDMKSVRYNKRTADWDLYHEFHMEFEQEGMTYELKFNGSIAPDSLKTVNEQMRR